MGADLCSDLLALGFEVEGLGCGFVVCHGGRSGHAGGAVCSGVEAGDGGAGVGELDQCGQGGVEGFGVFPGALQGVVYGLLSGVAVGG